MEDFGGLMVVFGGCSREKRERRRRRRMNEIRVESEGVGWRRREKSDFFFRGPRGRTVELRSIGPEPSKI